MSIAPERLQELRLLLEEWMGKNYHTLREIQQLLSKLNFVCYTV